MQRRSLAIVSRKRPAVWQFRWAEKDLHGARVQRKRVIGTVERWHTFRHHAESLICTQAHLAETEEVLQWVRLQ